MKGQDGFGFVIGSYNVQSVMPFIFSAHDHGLCPFWAAVFTNVKPVTMRDLLETHQIKIYFATIAAAVIASALSVISAVNISAALVPAINPALAFMLFVTFLQVPAAQWRASLAQGRFLPALLVANFVVIPLLVFGLIRFLPPDPLLRAGVALVLLAPCIDYVVTFAHLGRAHAKALLAATPILLLGQMLLLPLYLNSGIFNGAGGHSAQDHAGNLVQATPFLHAFIWLIAVPFAAATALKHQSRHAPRLQRYTTMLEAMPVPATALVLFIVVAALTPQLGHAGPYALTITPLYCAYAALAPVTGWICARLFRLDAPASRAIAFSAGTRNSLVVLPLAFAMPGAVPLLPAIIVTQTIVELLCAPLYIRLIGRWGEGDETGERKPRSVLARLSEF